MPMISYTDISNFKKYLRTFGEMGVVCSIFGTKSILKNKVTICMFLAMSRTIWAIHNVYCDRIQEKSTEQEFCMTRLDLV